MIGYRKTALIILSAIALLPVLLAVALPVIIRNMAVDAVKQATGRTVKIEKVSFNPLTLTAAVQGISVAEKEGGPFFSIAAIRISVSPTSIYRRALVLSGFSIQSPTLRIVRSQTGRFNFSDIMERGEKEGEPPAASLFPFVINNFHLAGGTLDFDDGAVPGGRKHTIRDLDIRLPWFGSLPQEADKEAAPCITALLNGASLAVTGKLKPFSGDRGSSIHIALRKLNLPELAVYLPQAPPVSPASAKLTIDADVSYRKPDDGKAELTASGIARLEAIELTMTDGKPLLKLPSLEVVASRIEPLALIYDIDKVRMDGLELFVSRDRQGKWMFTRLLESALPAQNKPDKISALEPPTNQRLSYSLASFSLHNGCLHFRDDLPAEGFKTSLENIAIGMENAASKPGETGRYKLSMTIDKEVSLAAKGTFTIVKPAMTSSFRVSGIQLQKGWPYLSSYLTAPLKGVVGLAGDVSFDSVNGLIAEKGNLTLNNFSTTYGSGEGISLANLAIADTSYNRKANRVETGRINLSEGNVALSRESDGRISLLSLLKAPPAGNTADVAARLKTRGAAQTVTSIPAQSQPRQPSANPLFSLFKQIDINRFTVAFTDKTRPGQPRFTLRDAKLSLANLTGSAPHPAKIQFSTVFNDDAHIQATGSITPAPLSYQGNLKVNRLPIRDFEPYYPDSLNFVVLGGLLDTDMKIDMAWKDGAPTGSFTGDAGIGSFHAIDALEEDLLKWQRLQLSGISGKIDPPGIEIEQVSLNDVYSRIVVRQDGIINLQDLIKNEHEETAVSEKAAISFTPDRAATKQPARVRIGNTTISDGTVSFTDRHLPNNFETTFYKLGGRISGLSSEPSMMADIDMRGNLENQSPLRITGRINPLRNDLFVDLKLSFTDIDLSPLSPYAETYLGYILQQGKLFLDLQYHIEGGKLLSENQIRVDQFTFGDQVESDRATSLPVRLGLALLKDRNGEIHLDVPVTGRLDDPQFNIWRIVFKVITNVLVKAVTAPFSLLSSLFGEGGDLSVIAFSPGSHSLLPSEEKKLESLAKALNDRTSLKVSLSAYVDKERDVEGYRKELLERRIKREKYLAMTRNAKTAAGQDETAITVSPEERQSLLKSVYGREKFPKPRDATGREISLPEPEMVKLILANTKVGQDELDDLAQERVDAALHFLIDRGKIPAKRIFRKTDDIFKVPSKKDTPHGRVELDAIAP